MLDKRQEVEKIKHRGHELPGVTKYLYGDTLEITVNMAKATFKGRKYTDLNSREKKEYEDLLYLAHVQDGNPLIKYSV